MKEIALINKKSGLYNAVVETPKHSRNKYAYDVKNGMFKLKKTLPEGMAFPYDFGFLPNTRAADGDPIDILLLMDQPTFPGCLVEVKIIGVIEAEQTEDGKATRNDRVVGVSEDSLIYKDIKDVKDLNSSLIEQLEMFFKNYNKIKGRKFKLLGCHGPVKAKNLIRKAAKANGRK